AQASKEDIPADIYTMAGGPGNEARARVIWIKLRLRQEFPESFAEARAPFPTTDGAGNANPYATAAVLAALAPKYNTQLGALTAGGNTESPALLALSLARGRSGVKLNLDNFGPAVADTNNDGLKEFVDDWRQPLAFYKWAINTGYITDLDATKPDSLSAKNRDDLDRDGQLLNPSWNNAANYQAMQGVYWFEKILHPVHDPAAANWTPTSC